MQNKNKWLGLLLTGSLLLPSAAMAAEKEETKEELPFTDIKNHWAKDAIIKAYEDGLLSGSGKEGSMKFNPDKTMSRAEFFVLFDRLVSYEAHEIRNFAASPGYFEEDYTERFDEPYLPYTDVDRLTWMYEPILDTHVLFERLYGPGALQQVFPGKIMKPNEPITREEVAGLLQAFAVTRGQKSAWDISQNWKWFGGEPKAKLKRAEIAVILERIQNFLEDRPMFTLFDFEGYDFPVTPFVDDSKVTFGDYEKPTEKEQEYLDLIKRIQDEGDDYDYYEAYDELQKVGPTLPNQAGVHYFMSWYDEISYAEALEHSSLALRKYTESGRDKTDEITILINGYYQNAVYAQDVIPDSIKQAHYEISEFAQKFAADSEQRKALDYYIACLKAEMGQTDEAIKLFSSMQDNDEALTNATYYLIQKGNIDGAKKLVEGAKESTMTKLLANELAVMEEQKALAEEVDKAWENLKKESYIMDNNQNTNDVMIKVRYEVDPKNQVSHANGIVQRPSSLVLDKFEVYRDDKTDTRFSSYATMDHVWHKEKQDSKTVTAVADWAMKKTTKERQELLKSYLVKQSFGKYDIITEVIPAENLSKASEDLTLEGGKISSIDPIINKYYIDRESGKLIRDVWLVNEYYKELDSSDDEELYYYSSYAPSYSAFGSSDYSGFGKVPALSIPESVTKEAVEAE
ncbi:S-layer homology domain-containing protein [Brevibacillus dissolubilis]|uniref:S-layer homology domain-containing protein n=1 Tax=Brevibacillus dissolubilis TaxID=1844116 RepID=UPI00111637BA|nr:S-layer homology domain-containing protein [Brevibacillus dissolubilis]